MSEQENKPEPLIFNDRGHERGDFRMAQTALRRGYPITDALREFMVKQSVEKAQCDDHRASVNALRLMFDMDKDNKDRLEKAEAGSVTVTKTESVTLSKEQTYTVRFDGDG